MSDWPDQDVDDVVDGEEPTAAQPEHIAEPEPLAERTPTGDEVIDEALSRLDDLDRHPVEDHPAAFEHVHRVLRESLSGQRSSDGSA